MHYLLATALAVEATVLHNFVWHQRWTWRDRPTASPGASAARLARFQLLNGSVSLCGNLALMSLLSGRAGLDPIAANIFSIVACSLLNFAGSHALVFAASRPQGMARNRGDRRCGRRFDRASERRGRQRLPRLAANDALGLEKLRASGGRRATSVRQPTRSLPRMPSGDRERGARMPRPAGRRCSSCAPRFLARPNRTCQTAASIIGSGRSSCRAGR